MRNIAEIKKEIEARFEAKFVKDWKLDFEGGYEELTNFISAELSAAIQEFAEAVKVEELTKGTNAWFNELRDEVKDFCPFCGIKPRILNTAISDIDKKVKEF